MVAFLLISLRIRVKRTTTPKTHTHITPGFGLGCRLGHPALPAPSPVPPSLGSSGARGQLQGPKWEIRANVGRRAQLLGWN